MAQRVDERVWVKKVDTQSIMERYKDKIDDIHRDLTQSCESPLVIKRELTEDTLTEVEGSPVREGQKEEIDLESVLSVSVSKVSFYRDRAEGKIKELSDSDSDDSEQETEDLEASIMSKLGRAFKKELGAAEVLQLSDTDSDDS